MGFIRTFNISQTIYFLFKLFFVAIKCGANTRVVQQHKHKNCYYNCQNRNELFACPAMLKIGQYCECTDGYIFLSGATGDCVKPDDCPK